ncbi:MAG: D-alanyl-D-alanine carboxypeptidase [Lachnospiraceae bacterium]|nr:D-alanyl-D-alanine carboxypeptidase [Lachnospiraceae bacterium]
MDENLDKEELDELRWKRHAEERQELRQKRRQQKLFKQRLKMASIAGVAVILIISIILIQKGKGNNSPENEEIMAAGQNLSAGLEEENGIEYASNSEINDFNNGNSGNDDVNNNASENTGSGEINEGNETDNPANADIGGTSSYIYTSTESTLYLGDEIDSSNAIFIDMETGNILADKGAKQRIVPASMTKVLTLLVAAENIDNLDDTFQITSEITDYSFVNGCSNAGFEKEEVVTVRDLLYGTNLPSGADAALGLAVYVSGSQEAFVELMNKKLEELGLSETAHFTNCIGIYDENHYCTVYDMAVIMNAALNNEICREVMSAHTYNTSITEQHPEGILLSNWFLRRIEDKDTGGEVICGKTGYVNESGSCAVSYGTDDKGRSYICVTVNANGKWKCIYDHVALYKRFSEL